MSYKSEFSCYQHNHRTQLWWGAQVRQSQASISLAAVVSTHLSFSCGSCKGFIASLCNVFVSEALPTCLQNSSFELFLDVVFWAVCCLLYLQLGQESSSVPFALPSACDFKLSACKWLLYRPLVLFLLCGCFLVVCSLVSLSFLFLRTRQAYR